MNCTAACQGVTPHAILGMKTADITIPTKSIMYRWYRVKSPTTLLAVGRFTAHPGLPSISISIAEYTAALAHTIRESLHIVFSLVPDLCVFFFDFW